MTNRLSVAIVAMLALGACSTPGDDTSGDDSGESAAEFCTEADLFINDRSVTDVTGFSPEFFADIDERLGQLADSAPAGVRADVEDLRAGFAGSDAIFSEFDYDTTDPGLATALERVDNEAMLGATDNIQRYLSETCGIDQADSPDPHQVADIMDAFDVDQALAECLNLELGDIASIDSEQLTPELLSRQVCGTSLIALLSGG